MGKMKITLDEWTHQCGDGCCTDWGCDLKVLDQQGEVVKRIESTDDVSALLEFLETLGYEVEWV